MTSPHPFATNSGAAEVPPAPPNIRIERLHIEGCGAVSAGAVRDGFREAWARADHSAQPWTPGSAEHFLAPLHLDLPAGVGGRELGRRLAEAILARGRAGDAATSTTPAPRRAAASNR